MASDNTEIKAAIDYGKQLKPYISYHIVHRCGLNPYQLTVIDYLISLSQANGGMEYGALTTYETMKSRTGISGRTLKRLVKKIEELGIITVQKAKDDWNHNLPNVYYVKLEWFIEHELNDEGRLVQAVERQRDGMALGRAIKKPKLAHLAESIMGNTVVDTDGVMLAKGRNQQNRRKKNEQNND